ncbi:hypothetical protein H4R18_003878 [Coemansia javaensis]|uniref:Phenazine biosynthesis protein PhzF family n=1 Tax=Coemansia javaensis TaxID=2761396 RepID=A0A9W8LHP7_9FUNG|nr:hypothetical protein H4R18_003878 [Coemansia javaensis]
MPTYKIFTVDAFAAAPFGGNQAAVVAVPPEHPLSDETMQALAGEMNVSETAFVEPLEGGGFQAAERFGLRWFTPTVEVPLCGHATLAAAQVLRGELGNASGALRFATLSGELVVRAGADGRLEMTLPADPPAAAAAAAATDDVRALVAAATGRRHTDATEVAVSPALRYMVVHDPGLGAADVAALEPGITAPVVEAGRRLGVRAVIVTARGTDCDFVSRFFAPWCGIDEDPVTGSAHAVLAPFWAARLGRRSFAARQCSRRGGDLRVALADDGATVVVGGHARVMIRGTIDL